MKGTVLRKLQQECDALLAALSKLFADEGISVGGLPGNDVHIHFNGSSTPVIFTTRFDEVIGLAARIERLLASNESVWRIEAYDGSGTAQSHRRFLISAVGSQPLD